MNIQEILKKENIGKQFRDDVDGVWVVCREVNFLDYPLTLKSKITGKNILDKKSLHEIVDLEFEKVINWYEISVDTQVIVKYKGKQYKRHFAKYEDGKIYTWNNGLTSFTVDSKDDCSYWGNVELYEEGEE